MPFVCMCVHVYVYENVFNAISSSIKAQRTTKKTRSTTTTLFAAFASTFPIAKLGIVWSNFFLVSQFSFAMRYYLLPILFVICIILVGNFGYWETGKWSLRKRSIRREETLVFKVQISLLRLVPQGTPEDQKITISIPWVDRRYRLKGTVADT